MLLFQLLIPKLSVKNQKGSSRFPWDKGIVKGYVAIKEKDMKWPFDTLSDTLEYTYIVIYACVYIFMRI